MKKVYYIDGLDCANCAAAIERALGKIDGINSASVNFLTTKMILDVEENNFSEIWSKIMKAVKKVEPDAEIREG